MIREYRHPVTDELISRQRYWQLMNPEKDRMLRSRRHRSLKDKEYQRKYYLEHREEKTAYQREYNEVNKDKIRAKRQARTSRKKAR